MGRFYLDVEYTNGNFYLGDIIEIALVSEESENIFHSYVKIHYSVPYLVQQLTNVTNKTIQGGLSFKVVMRSLIEFIFCEQVQRKTIPIIIAHGGFLHDFPMLFVNCIKNSCDNYSILRECVYVDSMQLFLSAGYKKPGIDGLCHVFNITNETRKHHSAIYDAEILMSICKHRIDILLSPHIMLTLNDILLRLKEKLPIPICKIFNLAMKCRSTNHTVYELRKLK